MKKVAKKVLVVTTILSFITLSISLINKLIYVLSSLDNRLYNPNSYFYQWKFGKIHYTVSGSGSPIVLIHGLKNGSSHYEWNKIVKVLSKNHTVYAIDLIGYGKSEKPKFIYTAYLFVQLLTDFITDVVDGTPDIVTSGQSNGFTTMVALQNNTLINRLVFINPEDLTELSKNPNTKDSILKYILETPILGTFIYNMISSKISFDRKFRRRYVTHTNSYLFKFVSAFYESSHLGESSNKFAYASNQCKFTNVNIIDSLKQINHSIHIIQGSQRDIDVERISSSYKTSNASIESSVVNKTKEFPHIENPDAIISLLNIYLHEQ